MPWKPPSVGDKHNKRWARISKQTRRAIPLCMLCSAGGRIEPATVVDHKLPLADGGTHEQENLMPLCKACHDGIKTPDDLRVRMRAERSRILVYACPLGATYEPDRKATAKILDSRDWRKKISESIGFDMAHEVTVSMLEGILRARVLGKLPPCDLVLVCDDSALARRAIGEFKTASVITPAGEPITESKTLGAVELDWLRSRYGIEYDSRHGNKTVGTQD